MLFLLKSKCQLGIQVPESKDLFLPVLLYLSSKNLPFISLLFFSLPVGPFPSKWSFILAALRNHMGSLPKITKTQANELPMPHPLSLITVAFLLDLEIPFLAHLLRIKTKIINKREGRLHRLPRKEAPGLLLALLMLFCFLRDPFFSCFGR